MFILNIDVECRSNEFLSLDAIIKSYAFASDRKSHYSILRDLLKIVVDL